MKMKKLLGACIALNTAMSLQAATIHDVTITRLGYDKNFPTALFIRTSTAPATVARPSCHSDTNWNYVLKIETPLEERMYSALLAAHNTKQKLSLVGAGNCSPYPAVEGLNVIYTNNP